MSPSPWWDQAVGAQTTALPLQTRAELRVDLLCLLCFIPRVTWPGATPAGAVHAAEPCLGRMRSPNPALILHRGKGKPAVVAVAISTDGMGSSSGLLCQHQGPSEERRSGSGPASEIHT